MEDEKVRDLVQNSNPANEPIDLAQAFKQYNQANAAAAQQPVETGQPNEQQAELGTDEGGSTTEAAVGNNTAGSEAVETQGTTPVADEPNGGASPDGSANVIEPIDYNPARERILKDIQQQAMESVRDEFRRQEIDMWSINDLYERDEQTGRVRFRNPDDPQHDFASRFEAQQFVDAMNRQITNEFRAAVNNKQRELLQTEAPKLRTIEFAPKYDAMDTITKEIFDDMIEPYAVRNNMGEIIGFNADLDAVAAQATKIAARFPKQQTAGTAQAAEEKKEPTSPALDMKTGAGKAEVKEPKNLGEALKMYDASQREAKKKDKKNG